MKSKHFGLAVLITALSTLVHAQSFPKPGSACTNDGDFSATDASGATALVCSNSTWMEPGKLQGVKVSLFAKTERSTTGTVSTSTSMQLGYVGVPLAQSQSTNQSYALVGSGGEMQTGVVKRGLSAKLTVVGFDPDGTAHAVVDLDASEITGVWQEHLNLIKIPVGRQVVIGRDEVAGVEYSLMVEKR